jgi:hypothetical protein
VANDGLAKIWYLNAIGLLFGWRHLLDGHSPFANSWQHRAADSFPYNLVTAEIRRKRAPDIHITNSAKLQLNKLWLEPKHLLRTLGASHFIFSQGSYPDKGYVWIVAGAYPTKKLALTGSMG